MKKYCVLIIILLLLLSSCADNPPPDDGIMSDIALRYGITKENFPKIDGSTSTLSIVQAIYKAMFNVTLSPTTASKTVPSYELLIDGKVDLIIVPYASTDVLALAEQKGVSLEFFPVAAEALVFITASENTAENITREQVRDIYLNYGIRNWQRLGGPDRELIPICRNADSGSQAEMDNLVLNNQKMHPDIQNNYIELTMEDMLYMVATYHNDWLGGHPTDSYALGYTLYTYLQGMDAVTGIGQSLKILQFDGIAPTAGSITDGSYPLGTAYYAVVRKDLPKNHSARSMIRFLQSQEGADWIKRATLIPFFE